MEHDESYYNLCFMLACYSLYFSKNEREYVKMYIGLVKHHTGDLPQSPEPGKRAMAALKKNFKTNQYRVKKDKVEGELSKLNKEADTIRMNIIENRNLGGGRLLEEVLNEKLNKLEKEINLRNSIIKVLNKIG